MRLFVLLMVLLPSTAFAAASQPVDPDVIKDIQQRLDDLEAENKALKKDLLQRLKKITVPTIHVMDGVNLRFSAYMDVGFFKAFGDGVAYVRDVGNASAPNEEAPWVFRGDPWANAVNSQGDSADLGLDRTTIPRADPIRSRGRPTFILNMVNIGIVATVGESLLFETTLNFEPRQGTLGSPGDWFEVALAYVEWIPFKTVDLHIFAGKFESVFGIEYRTRTAPDRFNVTPSLAGRYTMGTPLGLKIRGSLGKGVFSYAAALTNGSMFTERFGHFFDEIDSNVPKTGTMRLACKLPIPFFLEFGASGSIGAQDHQPSNTAKQWAVGADLKISVEGFTFRGEYMHVVTEGGGATEAAALRADAWYAEASYQILEWLGVFARLDHRRARLFTPPNLYLSDVMRVTGTVRFDVSFNLFLKLEYMRLISVTGPELDDDVITSSLVFRF
ncbi:MAG: hypothetical protein IT381_08935 [Deltaproteobacteria bacterium]|nr:hypothetical protein [Deltaproteobacteria bacterium]